MLKGGFILLKRTDNARKTKLKTIFIDLPINGILSFVKKTSLDEPQRNKQRLVDAAHDFAAYHSYFILESSLIDGTNLLQKRDGILIKPEIAFSELYMRG